MFGLMAFTVAFSLVGNEVRTLEKIGPAAGVAAIAVPPVGAAIVGAGIITTGGRIIIGGFAATSFLVLLAEAGDTGRKTAVGIATIAALSSMLIFGAPVWQLMSKIFGSKPTTPLGTTTANAPPTGNTGSTGNTGTTTTTTTTTGATKP